MDEYTRQRRIEKVRDAIKHNRLYSVRFNSDGSGAEFHYLDPVGDHGCPCTVACSFNITETILVVSGTRFKLHEINAFAD